MSLCWRCRVHDLDAVLEAGLASLHDYTLIA